MGNQNPDLLHQRILSLTLEIIYLLTGEGYTVTKKSGDGAPPQTCTDCMLGGACRHHVTPTVGALHAPGSALQKENAKRILELISNIIQLLTGEVAIRCEDVSLYFSLEEWQYLKGNQTRYREVIKENRQQLRPLGCAHGDGSASKPAVGAGLGKAKEPDKTGAEEGDPPNPDIAPTDPQTPTNCISHGGNREAAASGGEESDCRIFSLTEQTQGLVQPTGIVEANDQSGSGYGEPLLWELGDNSDSNVKPLEIRIKGPIPPTDIVAPGYGLRSSGNDASTGLKEEQVPWEEDEGSDCSIVFLTEPRPDRDPSADTGSSINGSLSANDTSDDIKEELCSLDEEFDAGAGQIQGKHQPTDDMGFHSSTYRTLVGGAAIGGKGSPPNTDISIDQHSPHCSPSDGSNGDAALWEENVDCNTDLRGTDSPAGIMGSSLSDCSPGVNCTLYTKVPPLQAEAQSFTCYECGKCFESQRDLFQHLRIHTGTKAFLCCECGVCFVHQIDLHRHMRGHAGGRPFCCSVCGKGFRSQSDCNRHLIIHTGEKPFACSECGRCFGFLSSLRRHFALHTRKEQFSCGHCGKCFALQSHLNNHLRIHSVRKPYRHGPTHVGETLFPCAQCGKDFGFESDLHQHLRTHDGNIAFSCPECGRGFECEGDLSRHLRTHEEKKPLSCSHCSKYFLCQSELKRHIRIHTGEKPFSCSKCGRSFGFLSSLRRHCRTHFKKEK